MHGFTKIPHNIILKYFLPKKKGGGGHYSVEMEFISVVGEIIVSGWDLSLLGFYKLGLQDWVLDFKGFKHQELNDCLFMQ